MKLISRLFTLLASPAFVVALFAMFAHVPAELTQDSTGYVESARFVDRDGRLLREMRANDQTRASWISLQEAGPIV
ncbi:MAG: hypothetical protein ACREJX_03110, partial [Polyangiaceae bacterium]